MREAGKIARHYFGGVTPERKPDNSLVTAADREVERFLVRELSQRFPDHCIVGEEYGVSAAKESRYVWSIDPIDGTAGFVSQLPTWTVCVGLLVDGVPQLGMVLMPCSEDLYTADPENGARLNGMPIHVDSSSEIRRDSTLLTFSYMHQDMDVSWPGRIWALSSAAATVIYAARGTITAGLVDKVNCYDIAAATAVLNHAGGELRYLSGRPVDFNTFLKEGRAEECLIATHPNKQEEALGYFRMK